MIKSPPTEFVLATTNLQENILDELLLRHSNLSRAVRVLVYCIQYISKFKTRRKEDGVSIIQHRRTAIMLLTKHVQSLNFNKELAVLRQGTRIAKGPLASLAPFLDENGIIRVGGRLGNSKFERDKKHPVLLPGNHIFTKLLFAEEHNRLLHAGPQLLLASERFWPLKSRNLARKIVKSCTRCFRANPKLTQPVMGHLLLARVRSAFSFETTGID